MHPFFLALVLAARHPHDRKFIVFMVRHALQPWSLGTPGPSAKSWPHFAPIFATSPKVTIAFAPATTNNLKPTPTTKQYG
jgi:hypothetical protein